MRNGRRRFWSSLNLSNLAMYTNLSAATFGSPGCLPCVSLCRSDISVLMTSYSGKPVGLRLPPLRLSSRICVRNCPRTNTCVRILRCVVSFDKDSAAPVRHISSAWPWPWFGTWLLGTYLPRQILRRCRDYRTQLHGSRICFQ